VLFLFPAAFDNGFLSLLHLRSESIVSSQFLTGVSGYLASHIAKLLIERGYDVRGSVRDLKSAKVTAAVELVSPLI
jgi:UDP-N-acetylmuramate-alanine ligase